MRPEVVEFMRACEKLIGSPLTNEECEEIAASLIRKLETNTDDDQPLASPLGALPPTID